MPNTRMKLKQALKPFVEWLDGAAASGIELLSPRALQEFATLPPSSLMQSAFLGVAAYGGSFSITAPVDLGAEKPFAASMALGIPLHSFAQYVAVVPTISQAISRCFGQVRQLFSRRLTGLRRGQLHRGRNGPNRTCFPRSNHNFVGVTLDPSVMFGIRPRCLRVRSRRETSSRLMMSSPPRPTGFRLQPTQAATAIPML